MADFVVLQDWSGIFRSRSVSLVAGSIIDDALFDIPDLRTAGVAVISVTSPVRAAIAQFEAARDADGDADLVATLLSNGLLGGGGSGSGDVTGPGSTQDGEVALWDGTSGDVLRSGPTIGTAANELVQLDASARLPAVDGSLLTGVTSAPSGTASGDLEGSYPNPTVDGLQGRAVASTAPTDQQVLTYNATASAWQPANVAQNSPAGAFLRASPAGALEQSSIVEEAAVIRSAKSFESPRASLFIGPNVRLFDVGEKLATEDMAQGDTYLVTLQQFTDSGSTRPEFLDFSAVELLSEQPVSSATQSASTHTFTINDPTAADEGITANAIFTLASVPAASAPIRIELFLGTDDTGPVLLDELFAPVLGNNTVDLPSPLTVRGSTDYFLRLSAASPFTLRGSSGPPFQLFYQLNGQVVTRRPLATQAEAGDAQSIQTNAVLAGTPTNLQALIWSTANTRFEPQSVVNSLGGLTGVITQQQLINLVNSGVTPPVLTNFHTTAPSRVDVSTDLGGTNYSATYDLANSDAITTARLIGFDTGSPGSPTVIVADSSRVEGANTQAWTFPAGVDFGTEGNSYTIRLEGYTSGQTVGTDTPTVSADQEIIAQAAQRGDVLYFGTSTDDTPANVDVTTLASQTRLDGPVTLPTWTGSEHVIFAYPDSAAAVTALNIGGLNQLAAFTLTAAAITVNSVSYSTLISINPLLGSVSSGTVVTIVR